jgi:hypothetical protein
MTEQSAVQPTYSADEWFAMGAEAFRFGQPLDLCPDYDEQPEAAHNWSSGWHAAEAEKRAEG